MQRFSTVFLQVAILLVASMTLVAMVRFPLTEGRAANLDLVSIYSDPLILYVYLASIPFFIGLYEAFAFLSLMEAKKAFSKKAVAKLQHIKIASFSLIGFIAGALIYIRFFIQGEDPAGPTMLGFIMAIVFGVIASTAATFQKILQGKKK